MWFCGGFSSISLDWSVRLSSRLVWYQILSVCFHGLQRGHPENPYEKVWVKKRLDHLMEIWQISCLEDVRQAQMDVSRPRGPRWRAMTSYNMARRTGFREQYYTGTRRYSVSGKIAGNIKVKLYMRLWWLFMNISGLINSFELSSFVVSDIISLLPWIAAGTSRKSIWERLGCSKVSSLDRNLTYFMLRRH